MEERNYQELAEEYADNWFEYDEDNWIDEDDENEEDNYVNTDYDFME